MREQGEIRQKLKQAQFRHVKRILDNYFSSDGDWPREEVESIKREYRELFTNSPVHVIAKDFPDVAALMWVLGDRPDQPLVPGGTMVGKLGGVVLWADTEEEANRVRSIIEKLVEASNNHPSPASPIHEMAPTEQVGAKKSFWQRLFG